MSKVVLLLGLTSVGLGLASLHLVKQLREGDATIAELRDQVAALERQSTAVTPPIFTVTPAAPIAAAQPSEAPPKDASKSAAVRATAQAIASPVPTHMPSREDSIRMMREHREREQQLMQDPEYRQAVRLQTRNNLARQYPGVIEELGLDPSDADEFFGMLADQQMRTNELMRPLWEAQPGETTDPTAMQERHRNFRQSASDMQRNNEAELAARFGQNKLQAWKEYQSTVGMRYQLDHMRSTLSAQGVPLSDDLSKPMLKALAQAQKAEMEAHAVARPTTPGVGRLAANVAFEAGNMEWHLEQTRKRNQRMLDAISSYLTYEQRTAIEKEQQAQLKMQEAQMRLMRERGDVGTNRGFISSSGNALMPLQP